MNEELREALAEAIFDHHPMSRWGARNLADALMPTVLAFAEAEGRRRAAEAWDEGFDAGYLHVPGHDSPNPYRAAALAPENARPE